MSLSSLLIIFSSSFMALFPVINPLGNGFVVNGFFADLDPSQRKTAIQKLTINFIMIGVGTLLIGHLFLLIFGLAIPVIQLGGGILICKTAIELLGDSNSSDKEGTSQNVDSFKWKSIEQKIFYPITFPISIGPGSISVIFTLMASASVKGKLLHTGINYLVIALVIICMAFIEVGIVVGAMGLGFITEALGYANMFALSGIIVLVITLAFWLLVQQRHTVKLEVEETDSR